MSSVSSPSPSCGGLGCQQVLPTREGVKSTSHLMIRNRLATPLLRRSNALSRGRDRIRARPALGEGFPFSLFRSRDGGHSLTMAYVSQSPPIMPYGPISRVRFETWSSTGDTVTRGGITKAGNGRARRIVIEAAWSYRYPARVGREKQRKVAAAPRHVREIAWKAQTRLCGRFRVLLCKGKLPTVVATAIARELSAFIWAINREVRGTRPA